MVNIRFQADNARYSSDLNIIYANYNDVIIQNKLSYININIPAFLLLFLPLQ